MRTVQKFVTNDGKIFDTKEEATRHIDSLVSNILFPLADRIYTGKNRTEVAALIMNNLQTFEELISLSKDTILEDND